MCVRGRDLGARLAGSPHTASAGPGQLVANGRIPTHALLAAIEADEETDEEGA